MQTLLQPRQAETKFPCRLFEGVSVYYAIDSMGYHSKELCGQFIPLVFESSELSNLSQGDSVWILQDLYPQHSGFTKRSVNRIVRTPKSVRLYYGDGYLTTITTSDSEITAFAVSNENVLLEIVQQIGPMALLVNW